MNSKQIKFINSEEIFTNVLDVAMPDRNKEDGPTEISNRLKMTKLVCGRLFAKFLDTSLSLFNNKKQGLVLGDHVIFFTCNDRKCPAVRGKIVLVDHPVKENEELYKLAFELDDGFVYKEDVEDSYKFKLYRGKLENLTPPSEREESTVEDAIYINMKFIQDNKLDEKYFDIMATYLTGLLEYTDSVLRDEEASIKEFRGPNKVRPGYVITPMVGEFTEYYIFDNF